MTIILNNKDCEAFVNEFATKFPYDYTILRFWNGNAEGKDQVWERHTNRHWLNLCWWVALGGFLPNAVRDALDYNQFVVCGDAPEWAGEEGLNLKSLDDLLEGYIEGSVHDQDLAGLHILGSLINCAHFTSPMQAQAFIEKYQPKIWYGESHLFNAVLAESVVTKDDLDIFMHNINGKFENDTWVYIYKKYTEVTLEWKSELSTYMLGINDNEQELKRYTCVNNVVLDDEPHKLALLVLGYLLTAQSDVELQGRAAYLPSAFVDEIYVGYSHDILEEFRRNKVGLLQAAIKSINFFPILATGNELIKAAESFEALGKSVFMHKSGKYLVVNAECVGFARNDNQTQVAWYADKEAKLTGRNLFSVATAAEWID